MYNYLIFFQKVPSTISAVSLVHQINTAPWVLFAVNADSLLSAPQPQWICPPPKKIKKNWFKKCFWDSKSVCVLSTQSLICVSLSDLLKFRMLLCIVFSSISLIYVVCTFLFIFSKQCQIGIKQRLLLKVSKVLQMEILLGWLCAPAF